MLHNGKFFIHKPRKSFQLIRRLALKHFLKLWLVVLVTITGIGLGQKFSWFPIRYVKIVGSNSAELNTALRQTIKPLMQDSAQPINFSMLESRLKQWTCVERITLWSILPYTLIIHLNVREPVAIFQSNDKTSDQCDQWIDRSGFLFNSSSYTAKTPLPKLIGSREQSNQLLEYYQGLGGLLKSQSLRIATVHLDTENRCSVMLTNGIELLLGHFDPIKQMQQLIENHAFALHQPNKIAKLDLRYPSGMAVTFRETSL